MKVSKPRNKNSTSVSFSVLPRKLRLMKTSYIDLLIKRKRIFHSGV